MKQTMKKNDYLTPETRKYYYVTEINLCTSGVGTFESFDDQDEEFDMFNN